MGRRALTPRALARPLLAPTQPPHASPPHLPPPTPPTHPHPTRARADVPIVGCVTRLTHQKGIHLIKHAAWRTMERGAQFVLLGSAPEAKVQARARVCVCPCRPPRPCLRARPPTRTHSQQPSR